MYDAPSRAAERYHLFALPKPRAVRAIADLLIKLVRARAA